MTLLFSFARQVSIFDAAFSKVRGQENGESIFLETFLSPFKLLKQLCRAELEGIATYTGRSCGEGHQGGGGSLFPWLGGNTAFQLVQINLNFCRMADNALLRFLILFWGPVPFTSVQLLIYFNNMLKFGKQ